MQKLKNQSETICEAVGVFKSETDLQSAIDDLSYLGFDAAALSVLGDLSAEKQQAIESMKIQDLEENPDVPRTSYIPRETLGNLEGVLIGIPIYLSVVTVLTVIIAMGGTATTAVLASIIAGGFAGLMGFYVAMKFHKSHDQKINTQLERGGLILWVDTKNAEQEKQAIKILKENAAFDVHLFNMPIGKRQYSRL